MAFLADSEAAMSSASHEERATLGCFFDAQPMAGRAEGEHNSGGGMTYCPIEIGHFGQTEEWWRGRNGDQCRAFGRDLGRPGSGHVLARGRALRSTACLCDAAPVVPARLTALAVRVRVPHEVNSRTTTSCSEPRPERPQLPSASAGGAGPALAGASGFT